MINPERAGQGRPPHRPVSSEASRPWTRHDNGQQPQPQPDRRRSPTTRRTCSSSTTTTASARCSSRYLGDHGFRVTIAGNAAEARQHLAGLAFDLLIVDVMMPGEDGMALARSLRETSDVPVLMLTARSETESRIAGLESGADDYLAKPFEPRELLLRINAILKRADAARPRR